MKVGGVQTFLVWVKCGKSSSFKITEVGHCVFQSLIPGIGVTVAVVDASPIKTPGSCHCTRFLPPALNEPQSQPSFPLLYPITLSLHLSPTCFLLFPSTPTPVHSRNLFLFPREIHAPFLSPPCCLASLDLWVVT